jgi:hypothetical protein
MPRPPQLQPQQRNFADIDPEAPQPLILHEQPEYIFCLDVVTKTVEWLVENCDAGVDPDDLVTLLGSLDPGAALPKLLLHAGVWAPMYFNSVTFFDATITVFCAGVSKWVDGLVRAEVLNHDGVRGWETAFRALKDDFARLRDWVRDYLWKTEVCPANTLLPLDLTDVAPAFSSSGGMWSDRCTSTAAASSHPLPTRVLTTSVCWMSCSLSVRDDIILPNDRCNSSNNNSTNNAVLLPPGHQRQPLLPRPRCRWRSPPRTSPVVPRGPRAWRTHSSRMHNGAGWTLRILQGSRPGCSMRGIVS